MAERAQVTSVEAIEAFRSNLIVYVSKARSTVEEVSNEVMRARLWLQEDQRKYWEKEHHVRSRKLERAQAELSSARLSIMQETTAAQQMDVHRAQRAVHAAEAKLSVLKKWDRELEDRSEPLIKQVEQLHSFLCADMAKAVAHLAQVIKALEAYADVAPGGAPSAPQPDAPASETADGAAKEGGAA